MSELSDALKSQASYLEKAYGWTGDLEAAADELDAKDAIIAELVEALKWSRVGRAPTRLIKGQNDDIWNSWHKTEALIAKASQD